MTLPERFAALPAADRRLLLEAGMLVAAVKPVLRIAGLTGVRWLLASLIALVGRSRVRLVTHDPSRIAWAVAVVSRRWGVACLGQALVMKTMVELRASSATIRIGVRRGAAGEIESHAWIECAGGVPTVQPAAGAYSPLLALDRMRP